MLYGIEVNIIHVSGKILVVANGVFPITPLPDCELAIWSACDMCSRRKYARAEIPLDATPTGNEIGIVMGQRKNDMQVIRENDGSIYDIRPLLACEAEGAAKRDMIDQER